MEQAVSYYRFNTVILWRLADYNDIIICLLQRICSAHEG